MGSTIVILTETKNSTMRTSLLVLGALWSIFVGLAQGQRCPKPKLLKEFDLDAYGQGPWYEVARYRTDMVETSMDCVYGYYTKKGNNYTLEIEEVENGQRLAYSAYVDISAGDYRSGLLHYVWYAPSSRVVTPVLFLDVDYRSYVVKYFCYHEPMTNKIIEYAFIYSRTKQLTKKAKAAIKKYLDTAPFIDSNKFMWDDFVNSCNFRMGTTIENRLPSRLIPG